ncbi:MAG: nucleotidyltransferase domain-containing protein [Phycisphaerae bacterium]
MVDQSILDAARKYLRKLSERGVPVHFGVIFGSWATGTADEWSDIDLVVVSPRFDGPSEFRDVTFLWRTAARTDNRIEPVPCGLKQWEEDHCRPILRIARREGQRITL